MKALPGLAALMALCAPAPACADAWALPRSHVEEVTAPDGHIYRLMTAWPEGEPPRAGWPVLWLLDGEDNFAIAVMTARRLARAGARSGVREGIVAAIESGPLARRVLDYTPAVPGYAIPRGAPAAGLAIGGAEAFLDLLEGSMREKVARRWRVDPARQTLAGHSFGGVLALHAMFTHRDFSGFVAISPSLWFGGGAWAVRKNDAAASRAARLLVANDPAEGGPDAAAGPAAEVLVERWRGEGHEGRYIALPGQGHGSTMLSSMTAAITFAFAGDLQ